MSKSLEKQLLKETNSPKGFVILKLEDAKEIYNEIQRLKKIEKSVKQTEIVVADDKVSDEDLEKFKTQRKYIGSSEQCKVIPLCDEDTKRKLKALEKIKNKGCSYMEISLIVACRNYKDYCAEMNSGRIYPNRYEFEKAFKTQFEFHLLKEVLK